MVVAEGKDVVDDLAVTSLDEVDEDCGGVDVREQGAEEGLPFLAHEEHEGCVAGRGVHWAKGHDVEGEEGAVGAGKAELLSIAVLDGDLVEAGLGIETDPVQVASSRGKVFNGFVAAGDGECIRECAAEGREVGDPAQVQEGFDLGEHDGGFVDTVARRATGLRGGVAGVDAEFVVEDGPVDASGGEGVPVRLDDGGESVPVTRFEGGGNGDDGVEFSLVEGRVPEDAVVAGDGEVKGCGGLAQEGAVAIAGKDVS
eukprot:scaffold15024_cov155-Amphora_coffeaeformis.AAC.1